MRTDAEGTPGHSPRGAGETRSPPHRISIVRTKVEALLDSAEVSLVSARDCAADIVWEERVLRPFWALARRLARLSGREAAGGTAGGPLCGAGAERSGAGRQSDADEPLRGPPEPEGSGGDPGDGRGGGRGGWGWAESLARCERHLRLLEGVVAALDSMFAHESHAAELCAQARMRVLGACAFFWAATHQCTHHAATADAAAAHDEHFRAPQPLRPPPAVEAVTSQVVRSGADTIPMVPVVSPGNSPRGDGAQGDAPRASTARPAPVALPLAPALPAAFASHGAPTLLLPACGLASARIEDIVGALPGGALPRASVAGVAGVAGVAARPPSSPRSPLSPLPPQPPELPLPPLPPRAGSAAASELRWAVRDFLAVSHGIDSLVQEEVAAFGAASCISAGSTAASFSLVRSGRRLTSLRLQTPARARRPGGGRRAPRGRDGPRPA